MRVSLFLFHGFLCSIPGVQKHQCSVKQNPVNICVIHVALPGKLIFRWMKMPWYFIKPQYTHLGCGKGGCWVPTPGMDAKPSLQKAQTCPSSSFPNQFTPNHYWSHRSIFIPFLKTNVGWFQDISFFFAVTHSVANLSC